MNAYAPFLKFISVIVQQATLFTLAVGAVFALAAGLLLVFGSETAFRISERMNRWVSTRTAIIPSNRSAAFRACSRFPSRMTAAARGWPFPRFTLANTSLIAATETTWAYRTWGSSLPMRCS